MRLKRQYVHGGPQLVAVCGHMSIALIAEFKRMRIKRQYLHGGPQHAHQKEIKRQYLHGGPQHAHPLELGD